MPTKMGLRRGLAGVLTALIVAAALWAGDTLAAPPPPAGRGERLWIGDVPVREPTEAGPPLAGIQGLDDWSRIVWQSYRDGNWEIYVARANLGEMRRLTDHPGADTRPRLNREAARVAFTSNRAGSFDVYTINVDGSGLQRLTSSQADEAGPAWSGDGRRLVFASNRDGNWELYTMNADGSGQTRLTFAGDYYDVMPNWSPDGRRIAWVRGDESGSALWVMNADGSDQRAIMNPRQDVQNPVWSPDSRYIAFDCCPAGSSRNSMYIADPNNFLFNVSDSRAAYGEEGAWMGSWSPDGRWHIFTHLRWEYLGEGQWVLSWARVRRHRIDISVAGETLIASGYDMLPDWQSMDLIPPTTRMHSLPPLMRQGPITVRWEATDGGPSGVYGYETQYRDGVYGNWMIWSRFTPERSATFAGQAGHTYGFRVRATDNAGNEEAWPGEQAGARTTVYAWQVAGTVRDNRGIAIPNATLTAAPAAIYSLASAADGRYHGYLQASGPHEFTATKPGYGSTPPLSLEVAADVTVDHVLPPADDCLQDGGFERGALADGWQPFGGAGTVLTSTVRHSGALAAVLGASAAGAGDCGLSQTVAIPAGLHRATASFLYRTEGAPAAGDRLYLAVGREGTTQEVKAITAASSAWAQAWADLSAWSGQTVTLTLGLHRGAGSTLRAYVDEVSLGSWLTPVVEEVSPSRIDGRAAAEITIRGDNLLGTPTVRLRRNVLQVQRIDEHTLRATVPEGLWPGVYDLWVANPGGQEGALPGGLTIGQQCYLPAIAQGFWP